ncbi:MAG: glycosyltransferase family 39 protein [bacterium]
MTKVSKKIIFIVFFSILLIISSIVIFLHSEMPYAAYCIYLALAPLLLYALKDVKMEKQALKYSTLMLISVVFISLGQYVYSYFQESLIIYGTLLFAIAAGLMIIANVKYPQPSKVKEEYPKVWVEIAAVVGIFALAIFLRTFKMSVLPPGIWFDEALNGTETMDLINKNVLTVFIPKQTQMPAMFFYLAAFFYKIFGNGLFQMRLVSILLGSLCVPAFYFILRYIFKNYKLALFGAFLLATSRWHINFSRVAFLGMQTVFLSIVFVYFYLRMIKEGKKIFAILAGLTAGLALYTYSTANFLPLVAIAGIFVMPFEFKTDTLKRRAINLIVLLGLLGLTALPLMSYAVQNKEAFSRRASDVSILNDINRLKSIAPLGKGLLRYSLMFNYEGDYNGRHNLYKKPAFDVITGVLLVAGLILALILPTYRFYVLWGLIMLLPGLLTIVVEAPQQYRTTGMLPPLYMLVVIGVAAIKNILEKINAKALYINIFLACLALGIAGINYKQYFIDYLKSPEVYISYAPESNEIWKFIEANNKNYTIVVDKGDCHYGYYGHETAEILNFMTAVKSKDKMFYWLNEKNKVSEEMLAGKKGVALIVRPCYVDKDSDCKTECVADIIKNIELEYKGKYTTASILNPFSGETQLLVYYIKTEDLKKWKAQEIKYFLRAE